MFTVEFETDTPLLREARRAAPEMTLAVESERAAGTDGAIRLLFWASGGDYEAFEEAVEGDPTVTGCERLADGSRWRLYRVAYTEEGRTWSAYPTWTALDAMLLDARIVRDGIAARMRFPDRDSFGEFSSWFEERELPFELTETRVGVPTPGTDAGAELTERQREVLLMARERGYFAVPREESLTGLAEDLGISDQAVSERIRRGLLALVEHEFGEHER